MSVDRSFMDMWIFDKEDPVVGFDKDIKQEDLKQFHIDEKQLTNDDWVCNADSFLDSILQMDSDDQPFEMLQSCDLLNNSDDVSDSFHLESSSCSDSGLSSDQQKSPIPSLHETEYDDDDDDDDDIEIKEEIIELDSTVYDELPTLDNDLLSSGHLINHKESRTYEQQSPIKEKPIENVIFKTNQQFNKTKQHKLSPIQIVTSVTGGIEIHSVVN